MALAVPLRRRLLPLLRQRRFMGTAAAVWAASTAAMGLFMRAPAALVAAVASGLSSALFPLAWGLFLGLSRPSVARRTVAGATALTAGIVVAGHLLPPAASFALACALPVAAWALLPRGSERPTSSIRPKSTPRVLAALAPFLASVLAFGAALGTFRGALFEGIGGNPMLGSVLFFAGMGAAALALLGAGRRQRGGLGPASTYKVALPVTVAALMGLDVDAAFTPYLSGVAMGAGFALYDVASWSMSSEVSYQTRTSPVAVTAMTRLASHAGMLAGAALGTAVEAGAVSAPGALAAVVTALVAAVSLSLGSMRVVSVQTPASFPAPGGGEPQGPGGAAASAASLQERFSLTDREAQVAAYIVAGYTRERIQEELFLSASTVKTHVGHVYEKTGAHSKQELMDVVRVLSERD